MIFGGVAVADWYFWMVVALFGGSVAALGYWYYYSRLKIGCKAVFSRLVNSEVKLVNGKNQFFGGVRRVIGERAFDVRMEDVKFRGRTFKLNLKKPSIQKFGWTYYDIDFDTGDVLTYGGVYESLDPADTEKYLNDGLIRRVVRAGGVGILSPMVVAILVVGVGVLMLVLGLTNGASVFPQHGLYRLLPNGTFVMTGVVF